MAIYYLFNKKFLIDLFNAMYEGLPAPKRKRRNKQVSVFQDEIVINWKL